MTSTSPAPVRPRTGKADALVCAGKPAQPRSIISMARMQGLDTAAKLLGGRQILGDAIGITDRTVRAKVSAERGITDSEVRLTIAALETKGKRLLEHAEKLRGEIPA